MRQRVVPGFETTFRTEIAIWPIGFQDRERRGLDLLCSLCGERGGKVIPTRLMPVLVVHVGRVRMCVNEPAMLVGMSMRFPCGVLGTVLMPVVLVVHMGMCMRQGLVSMFMFVAFREV